LNSYCTGGLLCPPRSPPPDEGGGADGADGADMRGPESPDGAMGMCDEFMGADGADGPGDDMRGASLFIPREPGPEPSKRPRSPFDISGAERGLRMTGTGDWIGPPPVCGPRPLGELPGGVRSMFPRLRGSRPFTSPPLPPESGGVTTTTLGPRPRLAGSPPASGVKCELSMPRPPRPVGCPSPAGLAGSVGLPELADLPPSFGLSLTKPPRQGLWPGGRPTGMIGGRFT
jgi:hypothetical protein